DAVPMSSSATYTLLVASTGASAGGVTVSVYDVVDVTGAIVAGGAAQPVTIGTPGQNAALTFPGVSGDRISLLGDSASGFNQTFSCDLNVSIRNPDASVLATTCMDAGGYIDLTTLLTTGTYTIAIDPVGQTTGSLTLALYAVPADSSGTITA